MLTVVLDTNIYISVYNFGGLAYQLIKHTQQGNVTVAISAPILEEIERILKTKFQWPEQDVADLLYIITKFTTLVAPRQTITAITRDLVDNRILECAVKANAQVIISGDKDVTSLKNYRGISIITPRQFFDEKWLSKKAA